MREADAELIASFQAGHGAALERLYERYAERVWRYARLFTGSQDAAAETVQETFMRVTRYLNGFRGQAQFATWLFTIVRSVSIESATKARRRPRPMENAAMAGLPSRVPDPLQNIVGEETRAAVRGAIERLPENEREAVLLCEIQEFSVREAAEVLGWTEARVKVTLFRGRRRLRDKLAAYVGAAARPVTRDD